MRLQFRLLSNIAVCGILFMSLTGCYTEHRQEVTDASEFDVAVCAQVPVTRTSLDGTVLEWAEGDVFGLFAEGLQYNRPFKSNGSSSFAGSFIVRDSKADKVAYRAYYPYSYQGMDAGNIVNATLPANQVAPFDPSTDFMVSDIVDAKYDEGDMPSLSFIFNEHLFGIVKITVKNTDVALADEQLAGVELRAKGKILAGSFTLDMSSEIPAPQFLEGVVDDKISVMYPDGTRPKLGLGAEHVIYAVVKTGTFLPDELSLYVHTANYVATTTNAMTVNLKNSEITALPVIDFGILNHSDRVRTLAFWGDSITNQVLIDYLQSILGSGWSVVRGGIPGDTPHGIAGRQGGVPMCFANSFTIPAKAGEKVETGRLYSTLNMQGAYAPGSVGLGSSYWFVPGNCSLLNNCIVSGVECVITWDEVQNRYYLERVADGEEVAVSKYTTIETFGSRRYADADVVVAYMGANGGTPNNVLADIYKAMADHATTGKFIAVGFHMGHISFPSGSGRDYWTPAYRDMFTTRFGRNFLDLRTVGNEQAVRLLMKTGVIRDESQMSEADRKSVSDGDWPASFSADYLTNVHPNTYGSRAFAIMVMDRMEELGYLDY